MLSLTYLLTYLFCSYIAASNTEIHERHVLRHGIRAFLLH